MNKTKAINRSQSLFVTNYGANHYRTYKQTRYNYKSVSAALPVTVYETAIRCAELQGYESVSAFVRDAVPDKVKATAAAMSANANEHYMLNI